VSGVLTEPLFRYLSASRLTKLALLFCSPTFTWDGRYRITTKTWRGLDYVTAVENLGGDGR
jgi:hypothetical protein